MSPETINDLGQHALMVTVQLSAPILLGTLLVGLVIAVFQAATQINEMTLTFVPKLIAIGIILVITGPYLLGLLVDYTRDLIRHIPALID